jgi:hypothetical protein
LGTTKRRSNVIASVQTKKTVGSSSPFRKGSIREKAYQYLQQTRTYEQFKVFCEKEGVSAQNLLRFLRRRLGEKLVEQHGTLHLH